MLSINKAIYIEDSVTRIMCAKCQNYNICNAIGLIPLSVLETTKNHAISNLNRKF